MARLRALAVLSAMLLAGALGAQEDIQKGRVKKVDADRGTLTLAADGKDIEVAITPQTRFAGAEQDGAGGLRWQQLKPGTPVMFKVADRDGKRVLVGLRVPGAGQRGEIRRGKVKTLDLQGLTLTLTVAGKDQVYHLSEETQVVGRRGKDLAEKLSGLREGAEVMFKSARRDGKEFIVGLKPDGGERPAPPAFDSSKLKPLTETGETLYQGHTGGLYPDGKNQRPPAHEKAGLALAKQIQPLDPDGKPSPTGKTVLLSVGMSNTSQASSGFQKELAADTDRNPALVFVNGAQGGMTAVRIMDPEGAGGGKQYWAEVDRRLRGAGVSRAQVQAVWMKQADAGPNEGFPGYAKKLQWEMARVVQVLHDRFPNLKVVYLSSRTYGGYARKRLNPEPYAYESGFAVKWLIERQIQGDPLLNYDPARGAVKAPWLSWGPYLWANGATKRADGFFYEEKDFAKDGTHLSPSGMEKVGQLMLRFFKTDTTTRPWFVRQGGFGPGRPPGVPIRDKTRGK